MHFCIWDFRQAQSGFRGIVKVGADVGQVREHHCRGAISPAKEVRVEEQVMADIEDNELT
jgi:hypothetical protein